MTDEFQCPAAGCEYTGTRNSVIGHYSGTRDDAHSGGWESAKIQLEDNGPTGQTIDVRTPEDDDTDDQAGETRQAAPARDRNPTMGSGPPQVQQVGPDPDPKTDESGEYVCYDCRGELVDFRDLETGKVHDVQGTEILVGGDYVCTDCGEWWEEA